jgi:23S rRNA pseudouridine1911/1915/1917 synthase
MTLPKPRISSVNYKVPDELGGLRLDAVLAQLSGQSRSSFDRQFEAETVLVNSKLGRPGQKVMPNDKIEVGAVPKPKVATAPSLKILYEDDQMLAIDKPAGLLTHPVTSDRTEPSVALFAASHSSDTDQNRPGIVHRLDKDTSGVLVIAKTTEAKKFLQNAFKKREVKKTYLGLVWGQLSEPEATIKLPLGRSRINPTRHAVNPSGREAVTHYKVKKSYSNASLVEIQLETGRTHQIRVHFAHLGHPVVGDREYSGGRKNQGLTRQFLHAASLEIPKLNGGRVNISSPLPTELKSYLDQLK